jgi:hypothetical protein
LASFAKSLVGGLQFSFTGTNLIVAAPNLLKPERFSIFVNGVIASVNHS